MHPEAMTDNNAKTNPSVGMKFKICLHLNLLAEICYNSSITCNELGCQHYLHANVCYKQAPSNGENVMLLA